MTIAAIGAAVVGVGGSLVSSNQAKQAAKGQAGTQQSAINANANQAAAVQPYNQMAQNVLGASPQSLAGIYGANPTYQPLNNAQLTGANNSATATLNNLTQSAPDYAAQAKQQLSDYQGQAAPQLQAAIKQIEQAAGSTGRVGAGGVTTSLGNLGSDYARNLQSAENALIEQSMNQGQQNALATEGATQNLSNLLYGQAAGQQGLQMNTDEQAIQNALAEQGQQTQKGLTLAEIGTGYNAVPGYQNAANAQTNQNNINNAGTGQLFDAFGNLIPTVVDAINKPKSSTPDYTAGGVGYGGT